MELYDNSSQVEQSVSTPFEFQLCPSIVGHHVIYSHESPQTLQDVQPLTDLTHHMFDAASLSTALSHNLAAAPLVPVVPCFLSNEKLPCLIVLLVA